MLNISTVGDVIYVCQSCVASRSLRLQSGTFCEATGLRQYAYVCMCSCVFVCVFQKTEWWEELDKVDFKDLHLVSTL